MAESNEVKKWENGINKWDFQAETAKANQDLLQNYGRDAFTFNPEKRVLDNLFYRHTEKAWSHGYPATSWLQLGIMYGCGLYTAKHQGIVKNGVYFQKYWTHHYFDWLKFLQRSFKYAFVGGFVAGTVLFGNPDLAIRSAVSKYHFLFSKKIEDVRANENNYTTKFNS